ncbi:unnamed protein product [Orchesella dallaii]|uniref:Uncharacterized protein n=1 Tax=Orchesella dallaii TaxID=48710 RepID=A0ABP1PTS5_9HEXA
MTAQPPASITYTPPGANQIFDGSTNTNDFLDQYDNYALVFSWSDDVKLSQFHFHLRGTPLKAHKLKLATATAAAPVTYTDMTKHIRDSFATSITPEEFRRQLQDRRKDPKESAESYYFDHYNHNRNYGRGRGSFRGKFRGDYQGRPYYSEPYYYDQSGIPLPPPAPPQYAQHKGQAHQIEYHLAPGPAPQGYTYNPGYVPYQGN